MPLRLMAFNPVQALEQRAAQLFADDIDPRAIYQAALSSAMMQLSTLVLLADERAAGVMVGRFSSERLLGDMLAGKRPKKYVPGAVETPDNLLTLWRMLPAAVKAAANNRTTALLTGIDAYV